MNDDTWQKLWQNHQATRAQTAQAAPAQPKKKGNFLTSLIPTGGGIAGTLGGAAAGAAAGSVVPIVGTAVGGLLGAILGGAGGSALGKVGQNAVEGNEDLGEGVAGEALLGGVTALPFGATARLAKAGVQATKGATKAAGDLVQEAGMKTISKGMVNRLAPTGALDDGAQSVLGRLTGKGTMDASAQSALARISGPTAAKTGQDASKFTLSGRLTDMGNKALASQYGTISKPIARSTRPTDTIAELAQMGVTKPADAERLAQAITGSDGIVNQAVLKSVGGAQGVDVSNVRRVFDDAIENYGIVDKDADSLRKVFDAQMNRLNGGVRGSLSTTVNPSETLATMKSLEKRIADLSGKGDNYRLTTPERGDQANVLRLVRDELQDSLYQGAGANSNLKNVLTPDVRESLVGLMPNNKAWAKNVDERIMGAGTVGDLRSSMSPFVRASKIIDEGDMNSMTFGGRAGNALTSNGIVGGIRDAVANIAQGPAARAAGTTLRAVGGAGAGDATQKAVGQSVLGATARQGGARLLTADAPTEEAPVDPAAAGLLDPNAQLGGPDQGAAQQQQSASPFGYSSAEIGNALMQAYAAGDKSGIAQLEGMYELASEMERAQGGGDLNATARANLATSGNAIGTLDQLQGLFQGAGGGSGKIAGSIANLGAGLGMNGDVQTYNDLSGSSVSQIAKAINGGGQVSDADAAVIVKALPLVTDSPAVAQAKFAALRQRLMTAQQNTISFGAGGMEPTANTLTAY